MLGKLRKYIQYVGIDINIGPIWDVHIIYICIPLLTVGVEGQYRHILIDQCTTIQRKGSISGEISHNGHK